MANTTIKAAQIVEAAVLLLQREIVLPRLVWAQPDAAFVGALNDTITLRVPAVLTARTKTLRDGVALTADEFAETSVAVKLDKWIYSLINVTDENLTLDIRDFSAQVLAPQMRAVAEAMENTIATAMAGANVHPGQYFTFDGTTAGQTPYETIVKAGAKLNALHVPRANRVFLCGTNVEASFLISDKLSKVNEAGTDTALRDATITRVGGFTVVGSQAIGVNEAYAFDKYAIAFANMAPTLPQGAPFSSRVATEGLALRYLRDYNPTGTNGPVDRSLVDAFVGAASVEQSSFNNRLVRMKFTGSDYSSV
jgi:hypothetical protein